MVAEIFFKNVLQGFGVYIGIVLLLLVATGFQASAFTSFLSTFGILGILGSVLLITLCNHIRYTYMEHVKYVGYPGPARWGFFDGNYTQMRQAQDKNKLFDLLRDWSTEHGDTFIFWRQHLVKWFTTDPDVIKSMLTEITIFQKTPLIPNRTLFGQRITGVSSFLTVADGQLWAKKRKVISPFFTKIHMADMFDSSKDFLQRGIDKQLEDITPGKTTIDLIEFYGELFQFFLGSLGFDLDCEYVSKNAKSHNQIIQRILKWVPQQFRPSLKEIVALRMNPEVIETIAMITEMRGKAQHIIDTKVEQLKKGKEMDANDIVHHIIKANRQASDDPHIVNEFQMDDMMTIFLVIDNMAKTLSTFFVRVMRDARIYEKIIREVMEADTSSLKNMDKSLRFTEMVILEVLRLHPTLMRGIRVLSQPTVLKCGLKIPSDSMIFFGQLVLHKHPKYWDNPDDFIPERFEAGTAHITPYTYLPFVAGPRVCMGKHLAMLSMKLAIILTLKNYNLRPPVGEEKEMDWDYRFTIVRPTKGHNAIFEPRNETASVA